MDISQKTIGIVGYGNFGKVIAHHLFPQNKIVIYTTQHIEPTGRISIATSYETVTQVADIIIPAVPIRHFEQTIKKLAETIKPQTVVMDICSVKEYPTRIMQQHLSKNPLIASHPMFGPNSIAKKGSIAHMKFVLHNISTDISLYEKLKIYFQQLGVNIVEITPGEHDQLASKSQFFTLLIGEVSQQMKLTQTIIDTPGTTALLDALEFSGADRHIIEDMITYNRFCKPLLQKSILALQELERHT